MTGYNQVHIQPAGPIHPFLVTNTQLPAEAHGNVVSPTAFLPQPGITAPFIHGYPQIVMDASQMSHNSAFTYPIPPYNSPFPSYSQPTPNFTWAAYGQPFVYNGWQTHNPITYHYFPAQPTSGDNVTPQMNAAIPPWRVEPPQLGHAEPPVADRNQHRDVHDLTSDGPNPQTVFDPFLNHITTANNLFESNDIEELSRVGFCTRVKASIFETARTEFLADSEKYGAVYKPLLQRLADDLSFNFPNEFRREDYAGLI